MDNSISYSVIFPTYNRAEMLRASLYALASQTVPKDAYEIVVINDGSRDSTDDVVKDFEKAHPELNLTYVRQENKGVSAARNAGIARAKGEIIFFTDDDCVAPPDWIETLADGYRRHPEVAGVGGWYEYPEAMRQNPYVRYSAHRLQRIYRGRMREEIKNSDFFSNPAGNTSTMSYRKSVLKESGGFDESIYFGGLVDWELKKRLSDRGTTLLYVPHAVLHIKPWGIGDVVKKFFNQARGRYILVRKNPDLFRFYYPSPALYAPAIRDGTLNMTVRYMACVDLFFTRLGWEYQKWYERYKE